MVETTIEPTTAPGAEGLLTTARRVRRRLDLTPPVARDQIVHCVEVALQAPTGPHGQIARFVCVDDPERRVALGRSTAGGGASGSRRPSMPAACRWRTLR
jgi:nitroreductase